MPDVDLIYSAGTCSVGVGATSVVGAATLWAQPTNVRQWDLISIDGGPLVPIVASPTDDTHITIPAWTGAVKAGVTYVIYQVSPLRFVGAQAMTDVEVMLAALNTDGWYRYVNPAFADPTAQGIVANEGQFALKFTTGQLWIMSGGVWVFLGVYKAIGVAAPFDITHTYSVNDVATLNGSSYIWINPTPGVGQTPPNATYWAILASKGDTGASYAATSTTTANLAALGATANLLLWSEDFTSGGAWIAQDTTLTAAGQFVDGSTSTLITEDTNNSAHYFIQLINIPAPGIYTASIFVFPNGRTKFGFQVYDGVDPLGGSFDIAAGTSLPNWASGAISSSITSVGGGWLRCQVVVNCANSGGGNFAILFTDNTGNGSYLGDGVSGIYAWGAQLTPGNGNFGYIKTTSMPAAGLSMITQAGLAYQTGARVRVASTVAPTNYFEILVTQYAGLILTGFVEKIVGSGTFSDWSLGITGDPAPSESATSATLLNLAGLGSTANLLLWSEDFTNAAWFPANLAVTANAIAAPDSTMTADKLTSTTTGGVNTNLIDQGQPVSINSDYTYSCFLKQGNTPVTTVNFWLSGGTFAQVSGEITWGGTPTISGVGASLDILPNGWIRASLTLNTGNNTSVTSRVYVRDGTTSDVSGDFVYAWGAQLTPGNGNFGYIKTTSAAASGTSLITQDGLAYQNGARVRVASTVAPTNYFEMLVTQYGGSILTGAVVRIVGSGTFSDWSLGITGDAAIGYGGTSATSLAIATGSKVFATQAGLGYNGARVRAASASVPTNYMEGVCAYTGTTLTMTVDATGGSGTVADWVLTIAGQPGIAGVGVLLAANNLADVVDKAASRVNLGIHQTTPLGTSQDFNLITAPGTYAPFDNTPINAPTVDWYYLEVEMFGQNPTKYCLQHAVGALTGIQYFRVQIAGTWGAWQRVMIGANNLSDVANAATARANLGSTTVGDALFTAASAAAARTSLGSTTVGDAVFVATTTEAARAAIGSSIGIPDVIVEDQKASGTIGDTQSGGTGVFFIRTLNTLVRNNNSIASLASNQITLGAGTYYFSWSAPAYFAGHHKTRFVNSTDGSVVAFGSTEYVPAGLADGAMTRSIGSCVVTITAFKTFNIQHVMGVASGTGGTAASQGTEVYSRLEITKLG